MARDHTVEDDDWNWCTILLLVMLVVFLVLMLIIVSASAAMYMSNQNEQSQDDYHYEEPYRRRPPSSPTWNTDPPPANPDWRVGDDESPVPTQRYPRPPTYPAYPSYAVAPNYNQVASPVIMPAQGRPQLTLHQQYLLAQYWSSRYREHQRKLQEEENLRRKAARQEDE